ncbi:MAG: DUF2804 domain-containing protein [Treponema sp.]|jgi:hypothetical protein|nr:DUF2804 domain-containing protein [Treponema sp.]
MYVREIREPRASPVENGIPLYGTWTQAFENTDLLGINRPYKWPLPGWITDGRIKEWETFAVQEEHFFLYAVLFNAKYYRSAQVFLYEKETKNLVRFVKFLPFTGWQLPRNLANASIESRSYGFFFRIHGWLDANSVQVDLNIKAAKKRPALTVQLTYDMDRETVIPMVVSLPFAERRCLCAYKAVTPVRGDIVFGGRHVSLDPAKTTGVFQDFKGFYPYRMASVWCTGTGFDSAGRRIGFSLAENQARETFKNNENALWVDGKLTPLPPVRITMPGGTESGWVIQDMEGMVDMTFTPEKPAKIATNLIITRFSYDTPLGYFNGMLLNSKGEQISIRNMWGIGEKLSIRV